jgi:hypothetical protein
MEQICSKYLSNGEHYIMNISQYLAQRHSLGSVES